MRKLFLASFSAETPAGSTTWQDSRLIAVDCESWQSEEFQREQACLIFKEWFFVNYTESQLVSLITHPTIIGRVEEDRAGRREVKLGEPETKPSRPERLKRKMKYRPIKS